MRHVKHPFPLIIDSNSKILILGSIPSVISIQKNFYYMNKTNRFYQVLEAIFHDNFTDENIENKIKLLKKHHIVLYDVILECDINNSSDSSISNVKVIDLNSLMLKYQIEKIFLNGQKAYQLFARHFKSLLPMATCLPSTSAANAKMSLNDLIYKWQIIKS